MINWQQKAICQTKVKKVHFENTVTPRANFNPRHSADAYGWTKFCHLRPPIANKYSGDRNTIHSDNGTIGSSVFECRLLEW